MFIVVVDVVVAVSVFVVVATAVFLAIDVVVCLLLLLAFSKPYHHAPIPRTAMCFSLVFPNKLVKF